MDKGGRSKSTIIHGIIDIQIIKRDTFVATKFCKNGPYKVFDEWVKSCFSKFVNVIADVSLIR